jgi:hypothetical protein
MWWIILYPPKEDNLCGKQGNALKSAQYKSTIDIQVCGHIWPLDKHLGGVHTGVIGYAMLHDMMFILRRDIYLSNSLVPTG